MKARLFATAFVLLSSLAIFALPPNPIEGRVRSVDPEELRVTVETDSGDIVAAYGTDATPVRFEGSIYRISNLEVGDRIRMTLAGTGDEQRVASIDVLESVSPSERLQPRPVEALAPVDVLAAPDEGVTLTSVIGKVDQTRADRNLFRIIANSGMSWVRIDATSARTPNGDVFKVSDLVFGETIEAVGRIGSNGELVATTVRRESEIGYEKDPIPVVVPAVTERSIEGVEPSVYEPRDIRWLDVVEFEGEVVTPPDGTQNLTIKNDETGRNETVWCDPSLIAMVDGDDPLPAEELESGMRVEIRALRTSEGLVVQSINVDD